MTVLVKTGRVTLIRSSVSGLFSVTMDGLKATAARAVKSMRSLVRRVVSLYRWICYKSGTKYELARPKRKVLTSRAGNIKAA